MYKLVTGRGAFGLLLICIFVWIGVLVLNQTTAKETKKVALEPFGILMSFDVKRGFKADPAKIVSAYDYNIARNLWSRLFEFDSDGLLRMMFATNISWVSETELRVELKREFVTRSGWRVRAEDAYLSFKRIMSLKTNTHGSLASLICPGVSLSSIETPCPGIQLEGDTLVLKVVDQRFAKFLIPLLTSADYSIIPSSAVDWRSAGYPIVNFQETSGVYWLSDSLFSSDADAVLLANSDHPFLTTATPREIHVYDFYSRSQVPSQIVELWRQEKIKWIVKAQSIPSELIKEICEQEVPFYFRHSEHIRLEFIDWTERGIKRFSAEERRYINSRFKSAFLQSDLAKGSEARQVIEAHQFYPPESEAALAPDFLEEISRLPQKNPTPSSATVYNMTFRSDFWPILSVALKPMIADAKFSPPERWDGLMKSLPSESMPDIVFGAVDTDFDHRLSQLVYASKMGMMGFQVSMPGEDWIQSYLDSDSKVERTNLVRDLHGTALRSGYTQPLILTTYSDLINKRARVDRYPFRASVPFWSITLSGI